MRKRNFASRWSNSYPTYDSSQRPLLIHLPLVHPLYAGPPLGCQRVTDLQLGNKETRMKREALGHRETTLTRGIHERSKERRGNRKPDLTHLSRARCLTPVLNTHSLNQRSSGLTASSTELANNRNYCLSECPIFPPYLPSGPMQHAGKHNKKARQRLPGRLGEQTQASPTTT